MTTLDKIKERIPSYMLFLLLAIVYLGCGFLVGYHTGYNTGQKDYIMYIEKLLEGVKANHADKAEAPAVKPEEVKKIEE